MKGSGAVYQCVEFTEQMAATGRKFGWQPHPRPGRGYDDGSGCTYRAAFATVADG
jgi:hypothetical protein